MTVGKSWSGEETSFAPSLFTIAHFKNALSSKSGSLYMWSGKILSLLYIYSESQFLCDRFFAWSVYIAFDDSVGKKSWKSLCWVNVKRSLESDERVDVVVPRSRRHFECILWCHRWGRFGSFSTLKFKWQGTRGNYNNGQVSEPCANVSPIVPYSSFVSQYFEYHEFFECQRSLLYRNVHDDNDSQTSILVLSY